MLKLIKKMKYNLKVDKNKKFFYFICLSIFSISINQYYGYIGVFPVDSFLFFDSGYRTLNGFFPFKDYWTPTGPLLDIIQAFFFKIFGISWFSYVLHASIFNFLIVIATFYTLIKFELNIHYCFFYALLTSITAYPTSGTPFIDHHSSILSLLALFSFILSLKTKLNFYWFLTPILLGSAFLSKQTPAGYIGLIIALFSLIYFIYNFNIKKILFFFTGSVSIITFFILFLLINKISFLSFYEQYILFPLNIGEGRFQHLIFPIEFKRIVLRFKLIHLSQLILIIIIFKNISKNIKYLKNEEFFILTSIITTSLALIFHQIVTINQKFIFFIIPILLGFSHIYFKKNFTNKIHVIYLLIFLGIGSTIYNKFNYIDNRKFMELADVNLKTSLNAISLDSRLKNLKWINPAYPNNPKKEIEYIKNSIKFIKKDSRKKMIITEYQFISSLMPDNVYSPSRTYLQNGASHPLKGDKQFETYKSFFINQIIKNDIKIIYTIKPLDSYVYFSILDENCVQKNKINEILNSHLILGCDILGN